MKIPVRKWLAACGALAFVACGGHVGQPKRDAAGGADSTEANDGGSAGALGTSISEAGNVEASEPATADSQSEGGAGDSYAGMGGAAPELSPSNSSGGSGAQIGGEEAGASGSSSPIIPSGTHLCTAPDDCPGSVECRGKASSSIQVCLKSCESDEDCTSSHRCVLPSAPLGPDAAGCFLRCEASPLICPYAFDCYDISGQQDYTCLPRQW